MNVGERQSALVPEHGMLAVDAALLGAARDLAEVASTPALRAAGEEAVGRLFRHAYAGMPESASLRLRVENALLDLIASLPDARMSGAQSELWRELRAAGVGLDAVRAECISLYEVAARRLSAAGVGRDAAFRALRRLLEFRFERAAAGHAEPASAETGGSSRDQLRAVLDRPRVLQFIRDLAHGARRASGIHAVLTLELRAADSPDEQGVDAIDAMVADAVRQIRPGLRGDDMIGRVGLSELAFLLPGLRNAGQAVLAANRIVQILETAHGHAAFRAVRPTAGIALMPEHGTEPETLLQLAGIAQAEARARGERYLVYSTEIAAHGAAMRQVQSAQLQSEFRTALRENELSLALQAQYDFAAASIVSSEALLRWQSRGQEVVASDVAVELAERSGLASSLTAWVLNNALRLSSELAHQGIDIGVSANVGAGDLSDPELPDLVDQGLRTWGIRPQRLTLEITENAMVTGIDRVLATLARLKEVGVALSIDDFGTGYSSLAYLGRLPVDELKIDKIFVQNMHRGRQDARMIGAIVDLARNFDLRVVAEGVEDERTFDALRLLGCHRIQGYYVAQPMAIDDFRSWMALSRGK